MRRTLINQIVRMTLLVPMCLISFSFLSCSDDDDDDSSSVSTADDGYAVSGKIDGHYYVDLGLSVKWATVNIGADSPEDYGNYYAWGETETKDSYTSSNSVTYGVEMSDISGRTKYDAATANWGDSWRMPTCDEMEELSDSCTWTWTKENGVNGYLVTGPNGNSIFLPAAGHRSDTSLYSAGFRGCYWSPTPYSSDNYDACSMDFGSYVNFGGTYYRSVSIIGRYYGQTVRPVSE